LAKIFGNTIKLVFAFFLNIGWNFYLIVQDG
jgi:hypothetical protein